MIHTIYAVFLFLSAVLTLFIMKKKPERKEVFLYLCLLGGWPGLHWLATRLKWMSVVQLIFGILIVWKMGHFPSLFVWLYLIFSLLPALVYGKAVRMTGVCLCMTLFSHGLYSLALYPPL